VSCRSCGRRRRGQRGRQKCVQQEMFKREYSRIFLRVTSTGKDGGADGRSSPGIRSDVRQEPPYFEDFGRSPTNRRRRRSARPRPRRGLGLTTDHISPAGAIPPAARGKYLIDHGGRTPGVQQFRRAPRKPRSDGPRTFGNIACATSWSSARATGPPPADGAEMTIFEASERYRSEGIR